MKTTFSSFGSEQFSFAQDPVLILEQFWSAEERKMFREAMDHSTWTALVDMPPVAHAFQNCGNWLKAEIAPAEGKHFLDRVGLPCVAEHIESFPNITGRHINFNYYSYGAGDCLSTHDDTDDAYTYAHGKIPPLAAWLWLRISTRNGNQIGVENSSCTMKYGMDMEKNVWKLTNASLPHLDPWRSLPSLDSIESVASIPWQGTTSASP